ncbi:SRPBCC family protein [Nocardia jinanensis]|uniref:Polyketide cyclase n=1 Tax=Nocardia jinanensis TaxID=382504 RepID=A0A917RPQ6_9NOCA|nr:SRPBCC family protein [Nocardia jinanensis]GGL17330.1 polyketide cyclase [Nocardia jinanensis]
MPAEPSVQIPLPAEDVFAILADGWLYGLWVVGATHIRKVDPGWPDTGSRIHHSVGGWPLTRNDTTEVLVVDAPHRLELGARLWPAGAARIRLNLIERRPDLTEVRMVERVYQGPGRLLPGVAQDLVLVPRNRESLRRLTALAVGRAATGMT